MKAIDSNGGAYPCRLNVALTTEQAMRIEESARLSGLKVGVYARHVLTSQPMPVPPIALIDRETLRVLQRMGNDLSTLAKQSLALGLAPNEQAAIRQAILDNAGLLRRALGLPPLSQGELELLHPHPMNMEYRAASPTTNGPDAMGGAIAT